MIVSSEFDEHFMRHGGWGGGNRKEGSFVLNIKFLEWIPSKEMWKS